MEQVAFIALRKGGQNFGKPIPSNLVMKEYVFDEIVEMHQNDSIRFYSEEGDSVEASGALSYLENFNLAHDFLNCKTREDYTRFIEKNGSNSDLGKEAMARIEEIIFESAKTEDDYRKFLMRFPNSPLAVQAKEKVSLNKHQKRLLVISSLEMINVNDSLMTVLEQQQYTSVSTAVLNDAHTFEDHVMGNDALLVLVDDNHYVEILTLFAYCLEYRKEMILIYEDSVELRKMTMGDVDKALMDLQTHSPNEHFSDVVRDIRLDVPSFVKKMSGLKKLKTNKMEALSACLN